MQIFDDDDDDDDEYASIYPHEGDEKWAVQARPDSRWESRFGRDNLAKMAAKLVVVVVVISHISSKLLPVFSLNNDNNNSSCCKWCDECVLCMFVCVWFVCLT